MLEKTVAEPVIIYRTETIPVTKNNIHELSSAVIDATGKIEENDVGDILHVQYSSFYNSNTGQEVYSALIVARIRYEMPKPVPTEEMASCHCPLRNENHLCNSDCEEFYRGCAKDKCEHYYD